MKDFFKMMFASTLGVIIATIILSLLSMLLFVGIAASFSSTPTYTLQQGTVLRIDLNGVISDRESQNPLDFLMSGTSTKTSGLNEILASIKKAKENEKIKGIYIKSGMVHSGYATIEPIRKALLDFKESGKFIVTYGENFSQRAYYAACVSDKIFMNPEGMFDFMGIGSSRQYNQEVFQKWGVDIQVFKVGTYKSAVEPYIQTGMSDANREQVTSYLNDIWGRLLDGIAESRNISKAQLNLYADECLAFTDQKKIVEYGLIDELAYPTDVENHIKSLLELKDDDKLKIATVKDMKSVPETKKKASKNKIAILYAEGSIVGDEMPSFYGGGITAKEYMKEINKLKDNDNVKAVVFRVNSPGGSAYASEQIWNAIRELKEKKPVVVSMGDYAASGGYYISCNATKIVAEPNTLTGSIGIFGMFPSGEQLSKKMGAHHDGVGTNKHSLFGGDILSIPFLEVGILPARKLDSEEMNMMQLYVERGYDTFMGRCADGRGKTKEEIDQIGQGRVWTGNQALALGLVDELGGIDTALQLAAEAAELEDYSVSEYPEQKDFFTQLMEESLGGAKVRFLKGILGSDTYQQKQEIKIWENFDLRQAIMEEFICQ